MDDAFTRLSHIDRPSLELMGSAFYLQPNRVEQVLLSDLAGAPGEARELSKCTACTESAASPRKLIELCCLVAGTSLLGAFCSCCL